MEPSDLTRATLSFHLWVLAITVYRGEVITFHLTLDIHLLIYSKKSIILNARGCQFVSESTILTMSPCFRCFANVSHSLTAT